MERTPRILSIQSTVSHGYVGHKAATFPLQCMGFDVDAINTVSLSNHPDYPNSFKGQFLSANDMRNTVQGLEENNLLNHDIIMNGYTRNIEVLHAIRDTVQKVKKNNPESIYICDPVLGDNDRFYVPEELLEVYKNELLPIADVITPNYFEVEVLTGLKVKSVEDAARASKIFHKMGVKIVIMTGQRLTEGAGTGTGTETATKTGTETVEQQIERKQQSILLSTMLPSASTTVVAAGGGGKRETADPDIDSDHAILRVDVPFISGYYYGCGDLFTALCASGIYCAGLMSDRVLTQRHQDQEKGEEEGENKTKAKAQLALRYLALMLDHSAWAMTSIIKATHDKSSKELLIVESIDIYRSIYAHWIEIIHADKHNDKASRSAATIATMATNACTLSTKIYEVSRPAYFVVGGLSQSSKCLGVIFDLDGTLTMPGQIDFDAMYSRTNLSKKNGSILSQVRAMSDPAVQASAMLAIEDEELKGSESLEIREELMDFMLKLRHSRIRIALSTLNSQIGLDCFMKKAGIASDTFYPAYHRDSLQGGICKPDPHVAISILNEWDARLHASIMSRSSLSATFTGTDTAPSTSTYLDGDVWFIGDSIDDMKCGKGAGCKTCLIRTAFNSHVETDHAHLVDMVVDRLMEWLDYIQA